MADIKVSQMGEVLVASDNDLLNIVSFDEQNQTYVSGKVKASTLKSYMVDDLEVSDLYDTTITTPTDDDGLVYDATAQKWENKQITTKEQWKKNGAYNLACGVFTSKVESGSTWIANSDDSVSVSGESTGSNITSTPFILKAGTYLVGFNPIPLSGGVTTDSTNFTIMDSSNNHLTGLPLNDATSKVITVAADTVVKIRLYAYANSSGHTTNTTFYPVITTDLNATVADFVSPTKTNRELTEKVDELYGSTNNKTSYIRGYYQYSNTISNILTLIQNFLTDISITNDLGVIDAVIAGNTPWSVRGYCYSTKDFAVLTAMRYDGSCKLFYRSSSVDTIKDFTTT